MTAPPRTPDGRYIIVDGVLWRATRPDLAEDDRQRLVNALMEGRRAVCDARDDAAMRKARNAVQAAKVALGERGPVWWSDGAPDLNRHLAKNTTYAAWAAVHDCKRKRNPT